MRAGRPGHCALRGFLVVMSLAELSCVTSSAGADPSSWQIAMDRGRERAKQRDWAGAVEHFNVAIEHAPERSVPRIERGNAYGELGQFAKAREDFERAAELDPNNPEPRYRTALVYIALDDQDGYRRACGELLPRFAMTDDPKVASPLAYTCVALPGAVQKPEVLVRWGEVAAPLFRGNERVLGAALYRTGRYKEAVQKLEDAAHVTTPVAWDWLFLAMSHHHLGHTDRAREYLTKAQQWINLANSKPSNRPTASRASWHSWNERAEVGALEREAEGLLNSGK